MLNIINNLGVFFEDCYRRINVREYSRISNVSPPTASKILFELNKEGLLNVERDRNYIFFYANRESKDFIDLSRMYWRGKLEELMEHLNKELIGSTIVLFGSLAKAEVKDDSDVDIVVFSEKKDLDLSKIERKLKRNIQLFWFDSIGAVKNKELVNNILNGYVLNGRLKI